MRIGINTSFVEPGKSGGAEVYIRNLLRQLQVLDKENEYFVIVYPNNADSFDFSSSNFHKVLVPHPPGGSIAGKLSRQREVNRKLRELRTEIWHCCGSELDPISSVCRTVVTVHDLLHVDFPDYLSLYERARRILKYALTARRASRFIAVSEFTKSRLVESYKIEPNLVDVIYHGVSGQFMQAMDSADANAVRESLGLPDQYFFYPANTYPHKNHRFLLDAFDLIWTKYGFNIPIVLSGVAGRAQGAFVQSLQARGLSSKVRLLGYVRDELIPTLYAGAKALVFPSLYEGFGMPVVEALAVGCPVICSDIPALREIGKDACLYFNPRNPADLSKKVAEFLHSPTLANELRLKGRMRASAFSWEKAATQTIETYRKALHE